MEERKEYKIYLIGFRIQKEIDALKIIALDLCNLYNMELVDVVEAEVKELYESQGWFGKPNTKERIIYRYYITCKGASTHALALKDGAKAARIGYNFHRA